MTASSKHETVPKFLFGTVSLRKGSGGIAELSRQVLKTLLAMQREEHIRLDVYVLEESGPSDDDDLLCGMNLDSVRWFAGHRWNFALNLITARVNTRLLDHVGLARLPGFLPSSLHVNYVLMIHGIELWNSTRPDYLRSARKADFLIANSEFTRTRVREKHSNLPAIRVCLPGKDAPECPESNLSADIRGIGQHALLIVGRLDPEQNHKGHDHLIEAMPAIVEAIPDAQLIIAGEGDDRERLMSKARDLGLQDHILFTGWVEEGELHHLYNRCALFVMLSVGDGFGLVFLEAMMHGTPCVGLASGSAAEIIEDGKTGILVDRNDSRVMADRIVELLKDRPAREKMAQAARARYNNGFRGQHYAARLRPILMDCVGFGH